MTDIALPNQPNRAASQGAFVEQTRAAAEVAAAVSTARTFPRDMVRAVEQMRQACAQKSLADRAFYSLPRAGGRVEGSTVHLARELARCYGNIDYGIRELSRDDENNQSEMQAWAWDQENNVRQSRSFIVPHARMKAKQREALNDLADITNNNNSAAARALREVILTVIPVWFRDEAENTAARTLAGTATELPLEQQIAEATKHFADVHNVTVGQIEKRLARPRMKWTVSDLATLRVINSELMRGEKIADEEFPEAAVQVAAIQPTLDEADPAYVAPEADR
jgi:hypothetical protein